MKRVFFLAWTRWLYAELGGETKQESFKLAHIFHIALIPESERIAHRRIQAGQTLRSILRDMVDVVKSSLSPAIGSYSWLLDFCFI